METILFMAILLLANSVQTITGFAGNLIAMPLSIRVVGIDTAKAVINIFTMVACLYISVRNYRSINWRILIKILAGMSLGMVLGVWIFGHFPVDLLIQLYGILIILIALKKMFVKKEIKLPDLFMLLVILLAGVVHGMFLSGGALLVTYAVSVLKDKNEFRATIAPVWVVMDALLIFSHYQDGYYSDANLTLMALSMAPLVMSIFIGNCLFKRLNMETFLKLTYILLMISGISVIL